MRNIDSYFRSLRKNETMNMKPENERKTDLARKWVDLRAMNLNHRSRDFFFLLPSLSIDSPACPKSKPSKKAGPHNCL